MSSTDADTTDASGQSSSAEAESYTALQWREEPPEKVGCFLYRASPDDITTVAETRRNAGRIVVGFPWRKGYKRPQNLEAVQRGEAQWAGPIPEPREPEAESAV